ncbi:MAG: anaerobic ribonucleoside-triphosphate reductase activating protein [Clostridiales bacterium]|nr:anaerobic ribonucleoside-triphosphate reductase activating protein [Clostridiales bacterium]
MVFLIIHGLIKTTLLDYPGHIASTIFLGGCNFLCPFCHNKDLVVNPNILPSISEEEILTFFKKRRATLEGVCITGGEPTLRKDLPQFISKIKDLGLKVKLDTNGTNPALLRYLSDNHLIDYVAMDIKNCIPKYQFTVGGTSLDIPALIESINFLLSNTIPYEFRTTVVKELHSKDNIIEVAKSIQGESKYFLQSFVSSKNQIVDGFTSYTSEELMDMLNAIKSYLPNAKLRGQA